MLLLILGVREVYLFNRLKWNEPNYPTLKMLLLDAEQRDSLWKEVINTIESYISQISHQRVSPLIDTDKIKSIITSVNFDNEISPKSAIDFVADGLLNLQVHSSHPMYFGLFNPAPSTMGIYADALVAAFNPQLASWSHNPFAVEIELLLIRSFAARFGFDEKKSCGTFCSGGAEANHTALIAALVNKFPKINEKGLRSLKKHPVFYVSEQSHHSFVKAARFCGLGDVSVREIKTDENYCLNVNDLEMQIERDLKKDCAPFMVVATAGTTNSGAIDDIEKIAEISSKRKIWLHTDAAWGGAAILVPELQPFLRGIERSDSISFDAHKWLSVPMGAGIFLTRHPDILNRACRISTAYMPKESGEFGGYDFHLNSMQWSRRFIGLKVFLSLAVAGWVGYEKTIRYQTEMGNYLRQELEKNDWEIVNKTPLPIVCFRDAKNSRLGDKEFIEKIADEVVASGEAWISATRLSNATPVLRACVTNFRTQRCNIRQLVGLLNKIRRNLQNQTN